jgi:FtsP/CotA-like multicopper oxidase with cupredoxin domain
MKKYALAVAILFVAGLALAQAGDAAKNPGKNHEVTAEVVSVDLTAGTITVKMANGENKTVPAKDKALEDMKALKAGDKVVLTCHDNDKGEHEGVVKISKA